MADKTIEILLKLNDQMGAQLEMNTRLMNEAAGAADKLNISVAKEAQAQEKSEKATRESNREHEKQKSLLGDISDGLSTGLASWVASTVAIGTVVSVLKTSIAAYDEAVRTEAELERALGFTSTALLQQANALQNVTRFEDDATRKAMARLAVYTQEESEIQRLIPLIQDFATAKEMDLASATELVAKSIYGETNMLGRYGVALGDADTKTEKLAAATAELERKFAGAAQVAGSQGVGGLIVFKNAVGDLSEEIGEKLLPYLDFWSEKLLGLASEWKDFIGEQDAVANATNEQIEVSKKLDETQMKLAGTLKTISRLESQRNGFYKDSQATLDARLEQLNAERKALEDTEKAQETVLAGLIKLAAKQSEEAKKPKTVLPELSDAEITAQEKAMEAANKSYEQMLYERSLIGLSEQETAIAERTRYWDTLIATDKAGGARHLDELRALKQMEIDTLRSGLPATGQVMDISGIYAPSAGTSYTLGQNTGGDQANAAAQAAQERNIKEMAERKAEAEKIAEQTRTGGLDPIDREKEQFEQRKALFEEYNLSTEELERQHQENLVSIEQEAQEKRLAAYSQFFGGMAALMTAVAGENKALQRAAQTAATIQATIDTYAAANKALASYPPPLSYIAAAGAVAYGMANVAQINKLHFSQGTMSPSASFGRVGGTSYTGDKVPIMANSGEGVLTSSQMDEYEGFKRGSISGGSVQVTYAPVYNYQPEPWQVDRDQINFARTMRGVNSDPANKRLQPSLA